MKTTTRVHIRTKKERHGLSRSPEYKAWQAMLDRCLNPSNTRFARYGGRGITVCERWRESFAAFYSDVGPRPSHAHSLDREKNDGNYEPGNVRWTTGDVQVRNTARNIYLEHGGRRMVLADWSRELGINYFTLLCRVRRGLSVEQVFAPVRRQGQS